MADVDPVGSPPPASAPTAGSLLRQAREAKGLHIAVLAATLKVPQRKLEALERNRLDELPDATFARALAQTVCRAMKIDPAPVLALLPRAEPAPLDQVSAGLNMPFRDRPGVLDPAMGSLLRRPATLIVLLLVIAALAIWFWPRNLGEGLRPSAAVAPQPAAPTPPLAAEPAPAVEPAASAPGSASDLPPVKVDSVLSLPLASEAALSADANAGTGTVGAGTGDKVVAAALLGVRVKLASWVEVRDASGQILLSRTVQPGEQVGLDGVLPLRLVIGNAQATELTFRGRAVDLQASTRDNVARVELR